MIRYFFLFLTMSITTLNLFSQSLEELVPGYANLLRSNNEKILETQLRNPSLKLLPNNAEFRRVVNSVMSDLSPTVLVETIYLYKKPEFAGKNHGIWDDNQKLAILNQLLSVSSLAGIQYFSASRGEMRTFFETSEVIDSPTAKKSLPDPVYRTLPASVSLYARQKDLTFGDNIYKYNFNVTQNCVYFIQENHTSLTYGIIPVIGVNNLKTILAIFDTGDSLLIYAASMAKASPAPGMGNRVGNSFGNRAEAVINWFTNRLNIVYN